MLGFLELVPGDDGVEDAQQQLVAVAQPQRQLREQRRSVHDAIAGLHQLLEVARNGLHVQTNVVLYVKRMLFFLQNSPQAVL